MKIIATGEEICPSRAQFLIEGGYLKERDGQLLIVVEEKDLIALARQFRVKLVEKFVVNPEIEWAFSAEATKGRMEVCP
jgi:hypothetical protein